MSAPLDAMEAALTPLQRALYELMSDMSEDCYCAGWMDGTERAVWQLVCGRRDSWGQGPNDTKLIHSIWALAQVCDSWIVWRDGPVAVPLGDWAADNLS